MLLNLSIPSFILGQVLSHPCERECNGEPMTCYFQMITRAQHTDQHGRRADGVRRPVLTFNGVLPGPTLVVCEGDTVKVDLVNNIVDGPISNADGSTSTTTLHFHGIREVGRTDQKEKVFGPWSDGVPYVTQCPVESNSTFHYTFIATRNNFNAPPGTYWYHSHVGTQRTNGLQGALVIKPDRKRSKVIDNPSKYTITLQEWYKSPTCQVPVSILVNGKSRRSIKSFDCNDEKEVNKYLRGFGGHFDKADEPSTKTFTTNYEVFKVRPGMKYRFRILGLIGQNFPIRFSIDDHKFTAIAADSLDIKPVKQLKYLWVAAGERFDIVVRTKKIGETTIPFPAFKMRFIGFTDLKDSSTAVCSIAYLKYPPFLSIDPNYVTPENCSDFDLDIFPPSYPADYRIINPPGKRTMDWNNRIQDPYSNEKTTTGCIYPISLRSKFENNTKFVLNKTFIDFNPVTTFNAIRTNFPDTPYLLQEPQDNTERCNGENLPNEFRVNSSGTLQYNCQHVLEYDFNPSGWAEIILINNNSEGAAHPIHQHGGWYWVVGEGQFCQNFDKQWIIDQYKKGNLQKNSIETSFVSSNWAVPKDVIQVPNRGYVIIRTRLDNPGTWIFHCHIDFHLSLGMGLGNNSFWTP